MALSMRHKSGLFGTDVVFAGMAAATLICAGKRAHERNLHKQGTAYRRWSRVARFAFVGFVTLPLYWALTGAFFALVLPLVAAVSPALALACFLLGFGRALLVTLRQLRQAYTGVVE